MYVLRIIIIIIIIIIMMTMMTAARGPAGRTRRKCRSGHVKSTKTKLPNKQNKQKQNKQQQKCIKRDIGASLCLHDRFHEFLSTGRSLGSLWVKSVKPSTKLISTLQITQMGSIPKQAQNTLTAACNFFGFQGMHRVG